MELVLIQWSKIRCLFDGWGSNIFFLPNLLYTVLILKLLQIFSRNCKGKWCCANLVWNMPAFLFFLFLGLAETCHQRTSLVCHPSGFMSLRCVSARVFCSGAAAREQERAWASCPSRSFRLEDLNCGPQCVVVDPAIPDPMHSHRRVHQPWCKSWCGHVLMQPGFFVRFHNAFRIQWKPSFFSNNRHQNPKPLNPWHKASNIMYFRPKLHVNDSWFAPEIWLLRGGVCAQRFFSQIFYLDFSHIQIFEINSNTRKDILAKMWSWASKKCPKVS